MAVSTTNAFDGPFIANGATTSFPFTFTAQTASDVRVLVDGADVSGYSVEIHADGGGTVSFDTAPATGSLLIWLDPDFAQTTAFEDGSAWLAGPVNAVNDRAALRDQALARDIGRGFMVPPGESGVALPVAAARAGKYFAFDAQGAAVLLPGTSPSPAQASMVAMSGGDSVDSAVEAQRFPTVAAMLLSTIAPAFAGRPWRAAGYNYVEAPAGVADYHLATAGGVLLYVLPVNGAASVEAFGAIGDGVADDTAVVQAATAWAASNRRVVVFPEGDYKITASIQPTVGMVFIGKGRARLVKAFNGHLFYTTVDRCEWHYLEIDGQNGAYTGYGIGCASSYNEIVGCNIHHCGSQTNDGGGVFFEKDSGATLVYHNKVINSEIHHNGWIGVACASAQYTQVIASRFYNNGLEAVTLDYDSLWSVVSSNTMVSNCQWGGVGSIGIDGGNLSTITGNMIQSTVWASSSYGGYGIGVQGNVRASNNITITGNVFVDNAAGGVNLRNRLDTGFNAGAFTISGNTFVGGALTKSIRADDGVFGLCIGPNTYEGGIQLPDTKSTDGNRMSAGLASFSANMNVGATDVTGDGTAYTMPYTNVLHAYGCSLDGGVFTADVSGLYRFSAGAWISGASSNMTYAMISLVPVSTTGASPIRSGQTPGGTGSSGQQLNISGLIRLNKGDTVSVQVAASGLAKVADIQNNAEFNWFSGELVG